MTLDFFTNDHQFNVTNTCVSKNGEVIAEGHIFVFYLMLGHPAYIIVNGNGPQPPVYIKTPPVTSILPHQEVYDGEVNPQKWIFEVNFKTYESGDWSSKKYTCWTVDEYHATDYIKSIFPDARELVVKVHQKLNRSKEGHTFA